MKVLHGKLRKLIKVVSLILSLILFPAAVGATNQIRLAILTDSSCAAAGDALLAELSTRSDLVLVERGQIRKVLAEQNLAALSFSNRGALVKLGQILSADVVLFLEKMPEVTPSAWRVEAIEVRTAIALGGLIGPESSLGKDSAPIRSLLQSALNKWRTPPARRHYLGILGMRSEELSRSLDSRADSIASFLAVDLGESPEVVILDREHSDRLQSEQALTGVELELKPSTLLLEGAVRYANPGPGFIFTFSLRHLAGGVEKSFVVTVAEDNVNAVRRAIAQAVLNQCQAVVPDFSTDGSKSEAVRFSERAKILAAHREFEPAARAAEAALTLQPSSEYRQQTAEIWNDYAFNRFVAKDAARMYRAALRFWELQEELIDEHLRRWQENQPVAVRLPVVHNLILSMCPLRAEWPIREFELNEARTELQRNCRSFYQRARTYYTARWNDGGNPTDADPEWEWTRLASENIEWFPVWTDKVQEWMELTRDAIEQLDAPPGKRPVLKNHLNPPEFNNFVLLARLVDWVPVSQFKSPEEIKLVCEFYDTLAQSTNAAARFSVLAAKSNFIAKRQVLGDPAPAKAALDFFLSDLPISHPSRAQRADGFFPAPVVHTLFRKLREPEAQDRYAHAILDPVLATHDLARINSWLHGVIADHLYNLESQGDKEAAYNWAGRILKIAYDYPSDGPRARELQQYLEGVQIRLKGITSQSPLNVNYLLESMALNSAPTNYGRVGRTAFQDNHLILAWENRPRFASNAVLHLTSVPLAGKGSQFLGKMSFPNLVPELSHLEALHCLVVESNAIYVGTSGGLVSFRDNQMALWTESEGLPFRDVVSAAPYAGKIYLGVGAGDAVLNGGLATSALVEFDAETRHFRTLASGRRQEIKTPFDGGLPYTLNVILPDAKRNCLWISVTCNGRPGDRSGLWKYFPATGDFQRMTHDDTCLHHLIWTNEKLLGVDSITGGVARGLLVYDPDSLQVTALLRARHLVSRNGPGLFGDIRTPLWPAVWTQNSLFTTGEIPPSRGIGQVFMMTDAVAQPQIITTSTGEVLRDVVSLHGIGDRTIAVTGSGNIWSLRSRPARAL